MHGMKGLEFQAVAVIGVEHGIVPAAAAVTPPTRTQSLMTRTCSENAAFCSWPAPGPETICMSPIPASRARSCMRQWHPRQRWSLRWVTRLADEAGNQMSFGGDQT